MVNTGKLRVHNIFPSVYHLLNSGEWMDSYEQWMESYEQKNHVKKRVKFRYAPRSSGSSRGAFSKNLFRDKGRTNDPAIFEIT